ncbi:MAG: hypothetical protein B1H13_14145 [Desulfobacteraceae bacterium 4484_190.3]|nr:MAG: hypothetical protein B1H13_14145 [Desulfobacteraceae bacterium 4484_190.3]
MINKDTLKSVAFFDDFSEEMLEKLAKKAEMREYVEGLYLNWRKPSADKMWVILRGTISLTVENDRGETIQLETLQEGDVLGFSSFIDIEPKEFISDARVKIPTRVLLFRADDILTLCHQDLEFGFLMMKKIAMIAKHRLITRTRLLCDISHEKEA